MKRSLGPSLDLAALALYILSALFFNSFVIIFVTTVLLAALDFWVVKNVSGRILVGLRWWNETNDEVISSDEQEGFLAILVDPLPDSAWIVLGVFSLIRFEADYLLIVVVCLTLSIANIVGFTRCRKERLAEKSNKEGSFSHVVCQANQQFFSAG
ncbi:hypothetical protein RHSIM_Rhsim05G0129200 [Rhododendron simsii]|uniref:Golgi apparatus membrane protein TVP23 n=1 Tax=Rhododendron simsii TaxID=118357 RepID=A0A834GWY2_RHOSS|nr:hypothetical protein RHSIM_Rhsim05G0129200 [Rhododendron simsii]